MPTSTVTASEVLELLEQAPFKFHLTGSRFFGYENLHSDWDYFVGIPRGGISVIRGWLADSGFVKEEHNGYSPRPIDPFNDALEVWSHRTGLVHVQIVDDPASKIDTQNAMRMVPGLADTLRVLTKDQRRAIWKSSRAIYHAGRSSRERGIV